ncbi:hypothetical protein [Parahaliea mediterranea]|uniref:hypothetical protein n=1 Tax=Parahaliea mediterranea TaxID=651086 RepID=UPI0013009F6B|nr:hypothetical protein [Parahaliea mediterranea]
MNTANVVAQGRAFVNVQEVSWESTVDANDSFLSATLPGDFGDTFQAPELDMDGVQEMLEPYIPVSPELPSAPPALDTANLFRVQPPSWGVPDFTDSAPSINTNVPFPTLPSVELPSDPGGAGAAIQVPEVSPPTFDDAMALPDIEQTDLVTAFKDARGENFQVLVDAAESYADAWIAQYCPEYSTGLAAIEARITDGIAGGNAMDEGWENAMYDRARVRVNEEAHRSQEAVTAEYARRGFAIPPGAVMSGLARAAQNTGSALAQANADIVVRRKEIEQQHLQFVLQLSTSIRQHFSGAMQNYLQLVFSANGQALEYAREVGRWASEMFNQRAELYRLEVQRYQAEAQVYAVRLESAFAIIRQFEVQIEAERLKIEVDRNEIALYEAKIRGQQQKVDLYTAQLQGVRTRLEAEAQKMSVFESQVRAYAARVSGKEAEFNAYRAAVQGDAARVDAYQAEVQAYGRRVDAIGTKVSAERAISQSVAEYNRAIIDHRDSTIRKYAAEIQGESARFDASSDAYRTALARYTAEVEARLRLINTSYEKDRLELNAAIARVETNLKAQTANVEGYIRSIASQAEITQSGGNIIGLMASSALTTNNTMITSEE